MKTKLPLLLLLFFGITSNAQVVIENYPGSSASIFQATNFINMNGKMYYFARTSGYQWSLYATDGSASGNQVVKNLGVQVANIMPQTDFDYAFNDFKAVYNGKLYFVASGQLWQSDGTIAGTISLSSNLDPKFFKFFNNKLYFTAYSAAANRELWSTDGTLAGTTLVKDIYVGATYPSFDSSRNPHFTVFNNKLWFVANDGINGYELWSSDGTT
ncbi:hypothetical protein [Flavobacterium sp.]|uniref:hypothetical protein n=1 Tax=Flavobacterium sp. TaxID=239 RepID=UPI0025FF71B8|nr:hypothetical protein [Flavobacterium sp.]